MATTVRSLIASTLRLLGVLSSNEPMTAAEADDALQVLNQLVDSWSNERYVLYTIGRLDVPLVVGHSLYTWGLPGGDIASPRPLQVEGVLLSLTGQDLEWPLVPYSQAAYQALAQKGLQNLYPQLWQYTPTYPLGELRLWPVPLEGHTLGVFPWVPLKRFASIETEVTFPPGYERALRYGLAIDLAPEYGREASATITATFAQAFAAIKRVNTVIPTLGMDPAYSGRQAGEWDATSGQAVWRR